MSHANRCLSDEMIVDTLLNQLPEQQMEQVEAHLKHCAHCHKRLEEWAVLLGTHSHPECEREIATSFPRIEKRLKKTIGFSKRRSKPLGPKPAVLSLISGLLVCFSLVTGWWASQDSNHEPSHMQSDLIQESQFLIDPQTLHYRIGLANNPHSQQWGVLAYSVKGNLWVNHASQEVIIFLEGLEPLDDRDYQVWINTGHAENNAGVVQMETDKAYLYWSGEETTGIEFIRISVEPKGGSQVPTGPEALFIRLNQSSLNYNPVGEHP
ncbi:hypothetical protein J2S00_000612 [Caldalkalibacillus uzonensis]|uniref:Anti-sigma K factor RskA C-terminal domain-containing protein n=1 Tax=Caldalkalibacillus uzonensis TaxID=353224 RepID=A0ABU0CN46_9BACI|nr:anti-sigma factor [Caldalkalibacillus uzonensis]MDQ0337829.1 hypothetical protein [Caldalkalibacillus uzonensis]